MTTQNDFGPVYGVDTYAGPDQQMLEIHTAHDTHRFHLDPLFALCLLEEVSVALAASREGSLGAAVGDRIAQIAAELNGSEEILEALRLEEQAARHTPSEGPVSGDDIARHREQTSKAWSIVRGEISTSTDHGGNLRSAISEVPRLAAGGTVHPGVSPRIIDALATGHAAQVAAAQAAGVLSRQVIA